MLSRIPFDFQPANGIRMQVVFFFFGHDSVIVVFYDSAIANPSGLSGIAG